MMTDKNTKKYNMYDLLGRQITEYGRLGQVLAQYRVSGWKKRPCEVFLTGEEWDKPNIQYGTPLTQEQFEELVLTGEMRYLGKRTTLE